MDHPDGTADLAEPAMWSATRKPFAGHFASAFFALGFMGSGLVAIPVLPGSGSVGLAELLGKKWGFSRSVGKALVFTGLVPSEGPPSAC